MEVDQANPTIFYASRFFGLAPYSIIVTAKGHQREFKLNILLSVYSVVLLVTMGEEKYIARDIDVIVFYLAPHCVCVIVISEL